MSLSSDKTLVAIGLADGGISVLTLNPLELVASFRDQSRNAIAVLLFPPGKLTLASVVVNGTILLWNWSAGTTTHTFSEVSQHKVFSIAFSLDSRRIISASGPKITVWDLQTSRSLWTINNKIDVSAVAFNSHGRQITCGTEEGVVRIWDMQASDLIYELQASASVKPIVLKPVSGGYQLVSYNRDN
jgi:WD40 repeat protein